MVKTWDFSVFLRLILRVIPMRQDENSDQLGAFFILETYHES